MAVADYLDRGIGLRGGMGCVRGVVYCDRSRRLSWRICRSLRNSQQSHLDELFTGGPQADSNVAFGHPARAANVSG